MNRPTTMIAARQLAFLVAAVALVLPLDAQSRLPPIIDMHMHALEAEAQGPPPMGMCPAEIAGFPAMEPGHPWADAFIFDNNAARFLKLTETEIARHAGR